MKYQPTIGLEVHAELKTRTKMFCDSLNDPLETRPNINVCPVCLAHPGALPTINKKAVEQVLRVGVALGSRVNPIAKFDRKNYFYPDLPKGYQISQYDQPLVEGGELKGIRIRRIHLEEDTARLVHGEDRSQDVSLVDYNRGGVPLMELVTEPDFRSAESVADFAKELQLILRYLGASDADMEKGQMRIEANVSLNMGTKVELKNINSFSAALEAVKYELARQEELIEKGETVSQETRGWDEAKRKTVSQRSKEDAHDYRYFPEPDLPPFETAVFDPQELQRNLPELPEAKRERFAREYGVAENTLKSLIESKQWGDYFEAAVSESDALEEKKEKKSQRAARLALVSNYFLSDVLGLINTKNISFEDAEEKITPEHLAHLVNLIIDGKIGSRQAKDILPKMLETGDDPESILEAEGLHTVSDEGELQKIAQEIIDANPAAADDYKKGKAASLQFLIGRAMGTLKGRGNPQVLKEIFERLLPPVK